MSGPLWRRGASLGLIACALSWVGWLLIKDGNGIRGALFTVNLAGLLPLLVLGVLANFHNGLVFHWQLRLIERQPVSFAFSGNLVFVGQVIRYLPGRFWHLLYQASVSHTLIPLSVLVRTNIEYMAIVTWTAVFVSLAVLASERSSGLALFTGLLGLGGLLAGFRYAWHVRILRLLANRLPSGRIRDVLARVGSPQPRRWPTVAWISAVLVTSWGVYFFAWTFFDQAWPAFSGLDLIELCALYTLAWLFGFLSMITPSGLGVREGAFALLAPELSADTLVLLMIVARLWLFLVELVLFLAFFPFSNRRSYADA